MKYYVFKHGENEDTAEWAIKIAIENKCCLSQYEFTKNNKKDKFQDEKVVKMRWNKLMEIETGDVMILASMGNTFKYAWGYAIAPRFSNKKLKKVKLNCRCTLNNKHCDFQYRSDNKYKGYIEFEDCECFYENLEERTGWGQRIDVDDWHDYNETPIEYKHEYKFASDTIQEISKKEALNIVRILSGNPNFEFEDKYK